MESLQEDVTELRATLGNRMNQFMEVIQAMAKGQEELRAAIQRPPIAETTTQNANLIPPPVTVQTTPTIGFVPPAGLVFTPPNGAGFIPPSGIGFVPPQGTGSVHPNINFGPRAGPMQFPDLKNQQQPLHHEEAQIPSVRNTVVTPAPHLVDNQED